MKILILVSIDTFPLTMKRLYLFFITHLQEVISGLKGSNSFVRNVVYNLSGNTIVLVIGFFLTPIIAKIYGPEAYGSFAIFTAICGIFQAISTFQLPSGYVAARTKLEFYTLVRLSFYALFATLFILLIFLSIYSQLENLILPNKLLNLIPLYVLFAGIFGILRGWNIKLLEFKKAATSRVFATVIGKTSTLSLGPILSASPMGLVYGSLVAFISESIGLVSKRVIIDAKIIFRIRITHKEALKTLKKYKQYPTFVAFNATINSLSTQIPIYFLAFYYDREIVGLYSLSASLILIPINLTGTSIAAVFLPKISSQIENKKERNKTVTNLYNKIVYTGLAGLIALSILLKFGLTFLLGEEWIVTSQISSFITLSFSFAMISIPLSVIYRLIHLEKLNLNITILFVFISSISLLLGAYLGDYLYSIYAYFFMTLVRQGLQIIILFKKLEINYLIVIRDLLILSFLYTLAFYLIKI